MWRWLRLYGVPMILGLWAACIALGAGRLPALWLAVIAVAVVLMVRELSRSYRERR